MYFGQISILGTTMEAPVTSRPAPDDRGARMAAGDRQRPAACRSRRRPPADESRAPVREARAGDRLARPVHLGFDPCAEPSDGCSRSGSSGLALAAALQALVESWDSTTGSGPELPRRPRRTRRPAGGRSPGTILLAGADGCRLATLDLATLRVLRRRSRRRARSGRRRTGEAPSSRSPGRFANGPNAWLAGLGAPSASRPSAGNRAGTVGWSPDGGRVAWCGEDRTTNVLRQCDRLDRALSGLPARFTGDGRLLTIVNDPDRRAVLRTETVVLAERPWTGFVRPRRGPIQPLGLDQRADGVLAVAVAATPLGRRPRRARPTNRSSRAPPSGRSRGARRRRLPLLRLQLWRGTSLDQVIALPGSLRRTARPASATWSTSAPVDTRSPSRHRGSGRRSSSSTCRSERAVLPPTRRLGFGWSPDGAWLALAGDDEIEVYGIARDEPVFRLPLEAFTLSWR